MNEQKEFIEIEPRLIGSKVEGRIIDGKTIVIESQERNILLESILIKGANLSVFQKEKKERLVEGIGRTSRQAKELETALGGEKQLIEYCQKMLLACVSSERQSETTGFVERYFGEHMKDGYLHFDKKGGLLKNRLEAIISSTHNLLELSSITNENEARQFMQSEEFGISFRERILRGWEKTGKVLVPLNREVARFEAGEIRTLPVGGIGVIIEHWLE